MMYQMAHVGINVLDVDASAAFYRNAFDMKEVFRMFPKSETNMMLVFLSDEKSSCFLALTWLENWKRPYDLGDNSVYLTFVTDNFAESYRKHKEMGIICSEGLERNLYYVEDPDGYWIAVVPENYHVCHYAAPRQGEGGNPALP